MNGLDVFGALGRRMQWLGARQTVLAQNVANVDTAGYRPRDLVEPSFRRLVVQQASLARTTDGHLQGRVRPPFPSVEAKENEIEVSMDGNGVDVEEELRKVSETAVEFQAVSNLYHRSFQMLRTAIGRGGA